MQNYVQIKTAEGSGSGVILSCEVDPEKVKIENDERSYIIFTNYHVIECIEQNSQDKKRNIKLNILDVNGNFIEDEMIKHIYVESGNNYNNASDVAALLVIIKECCKVAYSNSIFMGQHSGEMIEAIGYPHILHMEKISQDICMKAEIQKYTDQGMGLYRIHDDYHSYSNISDKSLMEGISGAPLYIRKNLKTYLVGINEAVCNIGAGNNPFKIVYFISIDQVLRWLSSQHIILYKYENKSVKILWIKGINAKNNKLDLEKPKNIVLVGGSGAGKSSFLKSISQHGDQLDATSDGQTTRATIIYQLNICEKNPKIAINFKNKKEFVEERLSKIRLRWYEYILCNKYGMEKADIIADPCTYLQTLMIKLMEERDAAGGNQDKTSEICNLLDEINRVICNYNLETDEDDILGQFYKVYDLLLEHLEENFSGDSPKTPEDLMTELEQMLTKEEGFFDIEEFYYLDKAGTAKEKYQAVFKQLYESGDIAEISKDFGEEDELEDQDMETPVIDKAKKINNNFLELASEYYQRVYENIQTSLEENGIDPHSVSYELDSLTKKEKSIIARCMRKVGSESLTAMIRNIIVQDKISDVYAYDLYLNKVNSLKLYDTCGFDHIERQNVKLYYKSLFNDIKIIKEIKTTENAEEEKKITYRNRIDAIIYMKKLDSEKPTELEKMLPIINSMEEATPIYCIFTAIDQYIDDNANIPPAMVWNREYYEKWKNESQSPGYVFPKIVQNLYENDKLKQNLKTPDYIKEKVAGFIRDHLIPYSTKYRVNDDNIINLNRNTIMNIVCSIMRDEWNLGFIDLNKKNSNIANETEMKKCIEADLQKMFKIASRTGWEKRHPSTATANFRRIYRYDINYDNREKDLGFNRTNIDRWDNLLEDGYSKSFLSGDGKTIEYLSREYKLQKRTVYEILARLKAEIITDSMGRWEKSESEGFRPLFESMYANSEVLLLTKGVNPFVRQKCKPNYTKGEKDAFLNIVCDFLRVLNLNKDIKDKIVEFIKDKIIEEISNNNIRYYELLIKYDPAFRESVGYIGKYFGKDLKGMKGEIKLLE